MKIVVVSGGFDPIHSGHIAYLKNAKELGDVLIVLLNSDAWLVKKKGEFFMPFSERSSILQSLECVNTVLDFQDDELGSCINGLKKVQKLYPNDEIMFCNGGDRTKENIPEMVLKDIEFRFEVGGGSKINSSSWILKNFRYPSESRVWGKFYNLFEDTDVKVKELVVAPGKGMSFQRHFKRHEIWLVSKGSCEINYSKDSPDNRKSVVLKKFDYYHVPLKEWHQITNPYDEPCHIIEIQYGEAVVEEDIERVDYYNPL